MEYWTLFTGTWTMCDRDFALRAVQHFNTSLRAEEFSVFRESAELEKKQRKIEEKQRKYCDSRNSKISKPPYQLKAAQYVKVKLDTMVRK
ncbi:hypothetical protein NDU88_002026 [Pleurodeles waltl]|uniref:Uncharacterized protein n=1 Tax=Pleurodeles waltl TaxID=8319 RepID=A0AAV7P8G8_PLEWA|nr:hypothetical protein NDU88_002026 [Pleurodeles waltl]